jgi:hypothetical protein
MALSLDREKIGKEEEERMNDWMREEGFPTSAT